MSSLSESLAKKLRVLEVRRDSLVRLLEQSDRDDLRPSYLRSIDQLTEEIESFQQALEYNHWLDDELSRGPWVEIGIADDEEDDPMDGVHIEIVDEDPEETEEKGVEVDLFSLPGDDPEETGMSANDVDRAERRGA